MAFEQLKDRIRETPISTIISHYMTLNKKGASLVGLCPFHADSKPSMNVSDAKGMFKCFACGAGGDAITFVKDFTKVEFVDALKDIAGKLGLPFEEYQKEKYNDDIERVISGYSMLRFAFIKKSPPKILNPTHRSLKKENSMQNLLRNFRLVMLQEIIHLNTIWKVYQKRKETLHSKLPWT